VVAFEAAADDGGVADDGAHVVEDLNREVIEAALLTLIDVVKRKQIKSIQTKVWI
jgi:hypothetical protein